MEGDEERKKIPRKRKSSVSDYVKRKRTKQAKTIKPKTVPGLQGDGRWELEEILDFDIIFGERKFLVKWKGWGPEFNSWEPLRNVFECQKAIINFFRSNQSPELEKKLKESCLKAKAEELIEVDNDTLEQFMKSKRINGKLNFTPLSKQEVDEKLKKLLLPGADEELQKEAKDAILAHKLGVLRKQQLLQLADWEQEMNLLAPHEAPISVENEFDLEVAPSQFTYIANYLPGPGVSLPEDPPIGCACTQCGPKTFCCNAQSDAPFAYKLGKLNVPQGTPIYECNKKCQCGDDCPNKVVQKGRQVRLAIYRTNNGCGWGVKAKQCIKTGTFICQYVGEVISSEEAEIRGQKYDADGRTYLFDLDFNDPENCMYTVDAAMYGNISHFINHSCNPNCAVFAVWGNCLDPNIPILGLFALRDIQAEEEISFSYVSQSQSRMSKSLHDATSHHASTPTACKCNAANCRKYLF